MVRKYYRTLAEAERHRRKGERIYYEPDQAKKMKKEFLGFFLE